MNIDELLDAAVSDYPGRDADPAPRWLYPLMLSGVLGSIAVFVTLVVLAAQALRWLAAVMVR